MKIAESNQQNDADAVHQEDDKENSKLAAPNTKMLSKKSSVRRLAERYKETEKLRTFSIQLQQMHEKGRRKHSSVSVSPSLSRNQLENVSSNGSGTYCNGTTCTEASATLFRTSDCRQLMGTSNNDLISSEQYKHQELAKEALRMASASTKVQALFRGIQVRNDMEAEKKAEEARLTRCIGAATFIQTEWRAHAAVTSFKHTISKTVELQAAVRMWIAMRRVKIMSDCVPMTIKSYQNELGCENITALDKLLNDPLLRLEQQLNAVSSIQSKWGAFAKTNSNHEFDAGRRMIEDEAATRISALWRMFSKLAAYKRAVRGTPYQ